MSIELESMAVEMPVVEGHPNRAEFRGVLTVVDVPSQRSPSGAKGKRVVLTRKAAEAALPSLIGMALDYAPAFDGHDARRKVGVITSADVVGRNLEVSGYLYAKDFPEIVQEVARCGRRRRNARPRTSDFRSQVSAGRHSHQSPEGRRLRDRLAAAVSELRGMIHAAREGQSGGDSPLVLRAEASGGGEGAGLGMSFELTKVNILDERARIWTLTDVTFTGAAILRKSKAAYQDTWIELCE
jgi:hypothetical protein